MTLPTTMKRLTHVLVSGIALSGLAACGAAPDAAETEDVAKPAQEEIITLLDPAGSRSRQRGAIQIIFDDGGNCSGTILNNNMILTAAHCLPQPNRNALYGVTIIYQHPTGDKRWDFRIDGVDKRMFFYHHPNQNESNREKVNPDWDLAIGAICNPLAPCQASNTTQSFGLSSTHFVTLSLRELKDNMGLTVNAYGAPETSVQHQMGIRVADAHTNWIDWEYVAPVQYMCSGDSGAPGFRNSGYSDSLGRYWQAQASDMNAVETNASVGNAKCGDRGKASNIRGKTDWIQSIVPFWNNQHCQQFTNPAGEQALWCWAT